MKKVGFDRRKEKAVETKDKLYAAADRLFTKHGFDEVSVDAIVQEAGLSKGAFYVHFESKDAVASALITDYVNKVDMDYQAFLHGLPADQSAADILTALVAKVFAVIEDQIGYGKMKMLYKIQLTQSGDAWTASGYQRALYNMLGDVLEMGIQRGEFKSSLPVDELARHLVLAMRGLTYEWCIRYPNFDLKAQGRTHFEIFLNGIMSNRIV